MFPMNDRQSLLPSFWCLCKVDLNPTIFLKDDQHIAFTIENNNNFFGFYGDYASTNYIIRRDLWRKLTPCIPNIPWCFIGDFNEIIEVDKYQGAKTPVPIPMNDFLLWFDSKHQIHFPTNGNQFTWANGRRGNALT